MDIISLFFIFIAIEIFESNWQKADDLYSFIENNFFVFRKNVFMYFILHLSFFYTIFLSLYLNNFGFWISSIIILKFLDISIKLTILKKLSQDMDIKEIIPMNIKMTPLYRYMNVLIYPLSFLFAVGLI